MPIRFLALCLAGAAMPLAGTANAGAAIAIGQPSSSSASETESPASRFAPREDLLETQIDYTAWDEALRYFVVYMGPSEGKLAPAVEPRLGSRVIFGHDSRLRLEGNRVGFSFLEDAQREALTAYREELEELGSQIDIPSLPRNEQLAYWLNLHNVAVIEQIALAYPVSRPSEIRIDCQGLDEARFLEVDGTALSLRDIRTKIVYPNWRDPRVIYGFFRGEIGGPTIQRSAFNAENVNIMLQGSGTDFVNSMRGVEKRGGTLHVSKLYEEAMPFFFADGDDKLRTHIRSLARENLREKIDRTETIRATISEPDISDLMKGDRSPEYVEVASISDPKNWGFATTNGPYNPIGVPWTVARLIEEKIEKIERMHKKGELRGRVIVIDPENPENSAIGREVD